MNIDIFKAIGGLGNVNGIPLISDVFEIWEYRKSEIIIIGQNKYFKGINGHHLLITGYDFDSNWDKGFLYKSKATISAPSGDTAFRNADVNNFFYSIDGKPNQIPVISLFENVDYAGKLFNRHYTQSVDYYTQVETYEARVWRTVLYKTQKTGVNLDLVNSEYKVPTKVIYSINVYAGDNLQAAITEATSGQTIYVYSGNYTINTALILNKAINIVAVGNVRLNATTSANLISIANSTSGQIVLKRLILSGLNITGNLVIVGSGTPSIKFTNCYIKDISTAFSNQLGRIKCNDSVFIFTGTGTTIPLRMETGGVCEFTGNLINIAAQLGTYVFYSSSSANCRLNMQNNKIISTRSGGAWNTGIIVINDSISCEILGNTIKTASSTMEDCISIFQSSYTNPNCRITHNYIYTKASTGHAIMIGTESTGTGNNKLDGAICQYNIIIGEPYYTPTLITTNQIHPILVGFNINFSVDYNFIFGCRYGIVIKSDGMTNVTGKVTYNGIYNCVIGLYAKGMNAVQFFNNTVYSNQAQNTTLATNAILLAINSTQGSKNCVVKNNIFNINTVYSNAIFVIDAASDVGTDSDANVMYSNKTSNIYSKGGTYLTFANWQAAGLDITSIQQNIVLSGNLVPSTPIKIGKNLGEVNEVGISELSDWKNFTAVSNIKHINQPLYSAWQVGAILIKEPVDSEGQPIADFYVSTTGKDTDPGTYLKPFATLQKAISMAETGDVIYLRGGTYNATVNKYNTNTAVYINRKNGNSSAYIKIYGYPGERPILDFSSSEGLTGTGTHNGVYMNNCSYFHIKNIVFQGVPQYTGGNAWGMSLQNTSHVVFENCVFKDNQGAGFSTYGTWEDILLINCDAHSNYDPLSTTPGGNADGFHVSFNTNTAGVITLRRCRSWNNSDDGFDCWENNGIVQFEDCWAWHNGYIPGTEIASGNGHGFKFGSMVVAGQENVILRKAYRCLSFKNRKSGFNQNSCNAIIQLYNCISYNNKTRGFWFFTYDVPHIIRNSVSYANLETDLFLSNTIHDHNSWDIPITVDDSDFISVSSIGMDVDRNIYGDLPNNNFLHLAQGSDLINAGIDVELPYNGAAPDIGAFEQ